MDVLVNKGVFKMHEVFLDELRKLNTRFMGMGIDVSEAIEEATQAFVEHDKKLAPVSYTHLTLPTILLV